MALTVKVTIPRMAWNPDTRALRSSVIRGAAAVAKDIRARINAGQQAGGAPIPLSPSDVDHVPMRDTGQTVGSIAAKGGRQNKLSATVAPRGYHSGDSGTKAIAAGKVKFVAGSNATLTGAGRKYRLKALRKKGLTPTSLILAVNQRRRSLDLLTPDDAMMSHANESIGKEMKRQQARLLKQVGTIQIK